MKSFARIAAILLLSAYPAQAAIHTVNSSLDTDDGTCDAANCTLREAVNAANVGTGDTIQFAIGSGAVNIALSSALPDLTAPVILDAATQPGYAGTPIVQLTGFNTSTNCLNVRASDTAVRGLDIGNCQDGINVLSSAGSAMTNIAIERNFIGTRLATATINRRGISLEATGTSTLSNVTIGNATPAGRNVLATFGFVQDSLYISGNVSDVTVAGNYFGVDESGAGLVSAARFTTDISLLGSASSDNIRIGGSTAGARNVFGSGGGTQVNFKIDTYGTNVTIEGNYIGTDPTGTIARRATTYAIWFLGEGEATIRNNFITSGSTAVSRGVTTTGDVIVQGNRINLKADGSGPFSLVNATAIHDFSNAPGYVIGGPNPGDGNVIANYHTAIFVASANALVQGNLVNLDPSGTTVIGSGTRGIWTSFAQFAPGVFIRNNTIAGAATGIDIGPEGIATVEENFIGTDVTGTLALPNANGIAISGAMGAAGNTTIADNVIAGNSGAGVMISTTTMPVTLTGNRIGVSASNMPLPNGSDGIRVTSGTGLKSIGTLLGSANTIANNGGAGVNITGGSQTVVMRNSIFNNAGLGIDLGTAGVTPPDLADTDTGANGLQNAPVLTSAANDAVATTVQGSLNSIPGTTFTIELYANTAADPTTYGEAQTVLTRFDVTTDGVGNALFSTPVPLQTPGTILSATATNTATLETSELSNDVVVFAGGTLAFSAAASSVNESAGIATITVTRTGGTIPASVQYASTDGTATAGSDYTAVAGTLNFGAADTSMTFDVPITNDALDEAGETVTLTLSGFSGGAAGTPITHTLTIDDDDDAPALAVSNTGVVEGNSGTTVMNFDVVLSPPSGQQVTVDYTTNDVTANAGSDYGTRFGTLTFAPGETSKSVAITVNGDVASEVDETLHVLLTSPVNASLADDTGAGTITNDDGDPTISIGSAVIIEGATGATSVIVAVTLSNPSGSTITVDHATRPNTATASDFTATAGTLTFGPGVTMQTVSVDVIGDTLVEGNEDFFIGLTNATNATIGDRDGEAEDGVTIVDDDGSPALTISNVAVDESAGTATLTVLLVPPSAQTVTVDWNTTGGAATAPADYTISSGTLTFNAGDTSSTILVSIADDSVAEDTETFNVLLTSPSNASIADGTAKVTIIDDDPIPVITIADLSVAEGDPATFTVALSNASASTITVDYATIGITASGADFTSVANTLTFNPGETTKTVDVVTNEETLQEPDETLVLSLTNASTNATIARPQATATIVDDDGTPALLVSDASVVEGNAGTVTASFLVTLVGNATQTVTVEYATANGTGVAGTDYATTTGHLVFTPGTTSQTIEVAVVGDLDVEVDETFFANLSNATNATISDNQALGTITNDDSAPVVPSISIGDGGVVEGNAGTSALTFDVTLSAPTTTTVTVDYTTSNTSATAGNDYAATSGTLLFAPGVTSRTISVAAVGDTLVEGNETFVIDLSNAVNGTLLDANATGTILDDDIAPVVPSISIGDGNAIEGDGGTTMMPFAVTLSAATTNTVTIDFATAANTAAAGMDFATGSGTLVFAPAVTTLVINVAIAGDTNVEGNETLVVNLSGATNATLLDASATGTIVDDDSTAATPSLSIDGARVTEGDSGMRNATFSVTLSAASAATVTVDYATQDATAVAGTDYVRANGSLVFTPGTTTRTITIAILGDTLVELEETFRVRLTNATAASIDDASANGVIMNDDIPATPPAMSIAPVTIVEGDSGVKFAAFLVTLSHASSATVTAGYATSDVTATAGADYVAASDTLTFAPGETSRAINVAILGDRIVEGDETFTVALQNPAGATLATDRATGTIEDDDGGAVRAVFVIAGSGAGNGGAFFRTQLQLHNPHEQPIAGDLVFRPTDGSAPRTFGYALAAHETAEVGHLVEGFVSVDVVPLTGPLPAGTMRVYNDGGENGAPGLLAPLVDVADALHAGDRALLIAPADAVALRYNIGIRSLDAGASVTLRLRRANGTIAETVDRNLAPDTLIHQSAASLLGVALEDNDAIEIHVTAGSAIVYGSAVENTSQDPSFLLAKRY